MADAEVKPPPGRGGGRRPRGARADIKKDTKGAAAFAAIPAGKSGIVPPSPGSFSPVFPTGVLEPFSTINIGLDFKSLLKNAKSFCDIMIETDTFNKVADHASTTQDQRVTFTNNLVNLTIAGGCLAGAQSIVQSHRTLTGTTGNTTAVYRPLSPLPVNLRVIGDQLGELDLLDGKKLRLKSGHIGPMARLLRSGDYILNNGWQDKAIAMAYYPATNMDESLDVELAIGINKILAEHASAPIKMFITCDDAFGGTIPQALQDVHATHAYSATDWQSIEFFYGKRPTTDAQNNVAGYWHLIEKAVDIRRPAVGGAQPSFNPTGYLQWATNIVEKLAESKFYYDKLFSLSDSTVHEGRVGSVTQLSTFRSAGAQITLRTEYPADAHSLSLAAIFHIGSFTDMYEAREPTGILMSVMTIAEMRQKFVRATMVNLA